MDLKLRSFCQDQTINFNFLAKAVQSAQNVWKFKHELRWRSLKMDLIRGHFNKKQIKGKLIHSQTQYTVISITSAGPVTFHHWKHLTAEVLGCTPCSHQWLRLKKNPFQVQGLVFPLFLPHTVHTNNHTHTHTVVTWSLSFISRRSVRDGVHEGKPLSYITSVHHVLDRILSYHWKESAGWTSVCVCVCADNG